jgi:serine/threonine-protein phosphatase 2A regulatory subunit B''
MALCDTLFVQEPVLFEDVLCQLHDMLQPAREGCYTLADVRRTRPQSSLLFNTLFNLHKFMAYENRCGGYSDGFEP